MRQGALPPSLQVLDSRRAYRLLLIRSMSRTVNVVAGFVRSVLVEENWNLADSQ